MEYSTIRTVLTIFACVLVISLSGTDVYSQQEGSTGAVEEEGFEILIRGTTNKRLRMDRLDVDSNMDRRLEDRRIMIERGWTEAQLEESRKQEDRRIMIERGWTEAQLEEWKKQVGRGLDEKIDRRFYRVRPEGYLGFKQQEWVEKIRFNPPKQEMSQKPYYKALAERLSVITSKILDAKQALSKYDRNNLELTHLCKEGPLDPFVAPNSEKSKQQLVVNRLRDAYRELEEKRGKVLDELRQLTGKEDCESTAADYEKNIKRTVIELTEVTRQIDLIINKESEFSRKLPLKY